MEEVIIEQALESPKRVESYYGETTVQTKESVYTWTIKNFSHFYMENKEIKSPMFTTRLEDSDIEWNLSFFPDGTEDADEGYTSLQFDTSEDSDEKIYVKFSTLFLNQGCFQEEIQHESYIAIFNLDEEAYVVENFLKKEDLPRFLHNGNLTIRCRVYFCSGTDESDVNETPETRVEKQTTVDRRVKELEDFANLFENEKFSDVTLAVGEEKFVAHKAVLAARSRVFAAMFEHNMTENKENLVTIIDVEAEVMREVLRFIYSAKVNDLESMAQGLLAAADKYDLNGLKLICEEAFIEKLSDKTVGEALLIADRYNGEKLRTATLEFITIHAAELASVESFNEAIKSLSPLLSSIIKTLMLKMYYVEMFVGVKFLKSI